MKSECADLRVQSNTLKANRETIVVSMIDRGPYGQIEDFSDDITVETLPSCNISENLQKTIAISLADQEVKYWLDVDQWNILQVGNLWVLRPLTWEEKS